MTDIAITADEKNTLLAMARDSIAHGLKHNKKISVNARDYSHNLQLHRATFVTLNLHQQLRGCIGTLEAHQPLIADVAEHAFAAAFEDPRFAAVTQSEFSQLEIHISILTPATAMTFTSEEDLLRQIQPGIDGLILKSGNCRGTFLPSVWEQLPEPKQFLKHLKMKAGLAENYWSGEIQVSRYRTVTIK
jgi:uncharacterized protein